MADEKVLNEALRFRPWTLPDPAFTLLLDEAAPAARAQIMQAFVEQQRAVLQAQVDFHTSVLGAMKAGGVKAGP